MAGGSSGVSLEQLLALNDEIAALVRAGVPLGEGLRSLAPDMPGKMGRALSTLAERLERGEPLTDALKAEKETFPPLYVAVVEAGVRSGNLPAALEGLALAGRRILELRRTAWLAMIYPMAVVLTAYCLGVFLFVYTMPVIIDMLQEWNVAAPARLDVITRWTAEYWRWLIVPPVVFVVALFLWWFVSMSRGVDDRARVGGWLPFSGRIAQWWRMATFADLLSLLVEFRTPLDEALVLAADASGSRRLSRAARAAAERIRTGASAAPAQGQPQLLPPLVEWMLAAGQDRGQLPDALRGAADMYRSRASRAASVVTTALPVLLVLFVSAPVVLFYALIVFAPWAMFLRQIAHPMANL